MSKRKRWHDIKLWFFRPYIIKITKPAKIDFWILQVLAFETVVVVIQLFIMLGDMTK